MRLFGNPPLRTNPLATAHFLTNLRDTLVSQVKGGREGEYFGLSTFHSPWFVVNLRFHPFHDGWSMA